MDKVFALIALLGWGIGDIFVVLAARRVGNVKTFFWQLLLATILTSLYIPLAWPMTDGKMFLCAAILGLLQFFGTLNYFKGLEIGNASLVGAVAGSFSVVVVLLSPFIYG